MRVVARSSRRGAALLLVLAAVLLVTVTTVAFARSVAASREHARAAMASRLADDLLHAATAPIERWLRESSGSLVLSPECSEPVVGVLHDRWTAAGLVHELRVTAWDQCGLRPIDLLDAARPPTPGPELVPTGLDLFVTVGSSPGGVSPFPSATSADPVGFGERDGSITDHTGESASPPDELPERALGASAATHNPPPGRININTAPRPLLEDALRRTGRGGLEWIMQSRRAGRAVSMANLPAAGRAGGRPDTRSPVLVSSSNSWSMRIDIRVGPVRRSWWSVYMQPRGRRWECVQRLAIPD